jgi:hypothetical protein
MQVTITWPWQCECVLAALDIKEQGMTEQESSTEASGEREVITIMLWELADTTGAVSSNTSHITALSTTLLGGAEGNLLRIGRGAMDPSIIADESMELSSTPVIEHFHLRPDWFSFGELPDPSAASDSWIVMIRGQLVDPDSAQAAHDAVAEVGAPPMREMGDIAHLPLTGATDSSQFLSIDVWDNDKYIEAMYGNPDVTAGFMQLFAEAPVLQVFRCS